MIIECPCLEDIDESAAFYSRQKTIYPIRCAGCLDIMTNKKWRSEVIPMILEHDQEAIEKDHAKFKVDYVAKQRGRPTAKPEILNGERPKRTRSIHRDQPSGMVQVQKEVGRKVSEAVEKIPKLPKPIKLHIGKTEPKPEPKPIKMIKKKEPDPNCPICAIPRLFGEVTKCVCMT